MAESSDEFLDADDEETSRRECAEEGTTDETCANRTVHVIRKNDSQDGASAKQATGHEPEAESDLRRSAASHISDLMRELSETKAAASLREQSLEKSLSQLGVKLRGKISELEHRVAQLQTNLDKQMRSTEAAELQRNTAVEQVKALTMKLNVAEEERERLGKQQLESTRRNEASNEVLKLQKEIALLQAARVDDSNNLKMADECISELMAEVDRLSASAEGVRSVTQPNTGLAHHLVEEAEPHRREEDTSGETQIVSENPSESEACEYEEPSSQPVRAFVTASPRSKVLLRQDMRVQSCDAQGFETFLSSSRDLWAKLEAALHEAKLEDKQHMLQRWCAESGARAMSEVIEHFHSLACYIGLKPLQQKRLLHILLDSEDVGTSAPAFVHDKGTDEHASPQASAPDIDDESFSTNEHQTERDHRSKATLSVVPQDGITQCSVQSHGDAALRPRCENTSETCDTEQQKYVLPPCQSGQSKESRNTHSRGVEGGLVSRHDTASEVPLETAATSEGKHAFQHEDWLPKLTKVLKDAKLEAQIQSAEAWCAERHITNTQTLLDSLDAFAGDLGLKPLQHTRLLRLLHSIQSSVHSAQTRDKDDSSKKAANQLPVEPDAQSAARQGLPVNREKSTKKFVFSFNPPTEAEASMPRTVRLHVDAQLGAGLDGHPTWYGMLVDYIHGQPGQPELQILDCITALGSTSLQELDAAACEECFGEALVDNIKATVEVYCETCGDLPSDLSLDWKMLQADLDSLSGDYDVDFAVLQDSGASSMELGPKLYFALASDRFFRR
eukprot:TRINITY_DN18651_c0_g1_i1.p1 TRINITY_DN18651_c0_g1~~TRINITY_DN18651_c0_g1_i1.p1  ORF type:complete len:789 (-),score=146.04 TRINITY_DN18651_c0_g1_i1:6-2372(-)